MPLVVLLAFLVGISGLARAEAGASGDELRKYCGGPNSWDEAYCARKIMTILEDNSGNGRQLRGLAICTPAGTTKGELVEVVKAWLKTHPNARQASATDFIARALSAKFPCR